MIRSVRAEVVRLLRRRTVVPGLVLVLTFAVTAPAVVLSAADTGAGSGRSGVSIEGLAAPGGGTEVFRVAASFAGTLLFVMFVGVAAADFARGTVRTSLLHQPRRLQLLAGRLAALCTVATATAALAEAVAWGTARSLAATYGVDAGAWASVDGLEAAVGDLGALVVWIVGYAVLGTSIGVLLRSVPVAIAAGIAWAGPFEHLVQDAWEPASRLFPGLVLEAFIAGGTPSVTAGRALATTAAYVAIAATVAAVAFARRDIAS